MTGKRPASSSRSTTPSDPKVLVGPLEPKDFSFEVSRDYIDASLWYDDNKTYIAGLPEVQGTFSGQLDPSYVDPTLALAEASVVPVVMEVSYVLPWWKALPYRMFGLAWPTYRAIEGQAYMDIEIVDRKYDGKLHFTGPVVFTSQPLTYVQRAKAAARRAGRTVKRFVLSFAPTKHVVLERIEPDEYEDYDDYYDQMERFERADLDPLQLDEDQ